SDKGLIDSWAEEGIWYMSEWGVMIGVGNNRFAPKNDYTREMSVMTMIRLYNLLLDNRPETVFISPGVTLVSDNGTDGYAADPEFFIKMKLPAGWTYNRLNGEFTDADNKPAATLSKLMIYPGGVPAMSDDEKGGVYYFTSGEKLMFSLHFNDRMSDAVKKCILGSVVIYDRVRPSITADIEAYMYDVNRRAAEAYGWFDMSTMSARHGIDDILRERTGTAQPIPELQLSAGGYREIGDSRIKTYADLEAYIKSLFSDDIAESLLSRDIYRDIGGKLHGLDAARGSDITKGGEKASVKRVDANKLIYTVRLELRGGDLNTVAGYETHEFVHEQVGQKWVWTKFYLYR
ncbi:MAG: hypothetical protein PHZ09_10540, partial [Eubacteriales bacterium]|nr:hypothetical protein [Eubacteriales bacterium]